MSDMTWQDLRDLDCEAIRDLGEAWKSHASTMAEQAQRIRDEVVGGHLSVENYESDTADTVREQLTLTADRFDDDLSDYATVRLSTSLLEAADAFEAEQGELEELIPLIESHGFEIDGDPDDYRVKPTGDLQWAINKLNPPQWLCDRVGINKPDGFLDWDTLNTLFNLQDLIAAAWSLGGQYEDWLQAVMSRAHDADDDAAAVLSEMRESAPGLPPQLGATYDDLVGDYKSELSEEIAEEMQAIAGGESGLSPGQVNEWWNNLSDAEREALIEEHPEWVGPTDGIPVESRDTANRVVLDREIDGIGGRITEVEQLMAEMEANGTDTVTGRYGQETSDAYAELEDELADLRQDRTDLENLQDHITDADGNPANFDGTGQPYYLLGFGTEGSGEAIVSIGNPDTADNVNAYVPGTGSNLDGASNGLMDRTETMARDADRWGDGGETATVLWMGYDAPDNLLEATDDKWAQEGSASLESFTQGIRSTAEGDPSNLTLTGHSYGTTMVGTAASTEGVDADNIMFVASPGVGTDTASALGVDESNVWASTNDEDVIQYGMVHGTDPTSAEFGGNEFASDSPREASAPWKFWEGAVENHSSYWDLNNETSRRNQSHIVTGQESGVS
ncbi:alpha/beta hydrolase [Glycomyces sp. L485]|uniref:alpha/beta hydrolase n=1 Tax=Glycomyces sp. L485 TaxID=2909235 RepID=UPI001F4ADB85|nr:alpha/beta hydrolase [Glycomyces sp. L485]MCH7232510.1 alpha/beta hydrolase [Glycomyces sp. L485]